MGIVVERSVELRAAPEQVWPIVADTDRLNRAIGLAPVELTPIDDASAARFLVRTVSAGFPLEYEERPFAFVEHRGFSVTRIVRKGALRSIENVYRLEPRAEGGSRLTITLDVEPRIGLLGPLVRWQSGRLLDRMIAAIAALDPELVAGRPSELMSSPPLCDQRALVRLEAELCARVDGADQPLARALVRWLETASDASVERIRPFALADRLGVDRTRMLAVCLHGVLVGLLELRWDLVCPSCHTATARLPRLDQLDAEASCTLCDIRFGVELDLAVEATFQPMRVVRTRRAGPYCIGGPLLTPHVVVQDVLEPHATHAITAPPRADRYRLFVRGGATATVVVADDAPSEVALRVAADQIEPNELSVAPGGTLRIRHDDPRARHLKLERIAAVEQAATAQRLALLPEFRATFGTDLLRPGVALRVGAVALVFTDLTASTALYAEIGDARAFKLVHDHFDVLAGVVATRGGAIVKTIGDAVMAAFDSELDALTAALAMHRGFDALRADNPDARRTSLKVGAHAGPCYAVTANGVLDYFGQTVNVAARVQSEAGAGELVVAEPLAQLAVARGLVERARVGERYLARLKGVAEPIALCRLRIDDRG